MTAEDAPTLTSEGLVALLDLRRLDEHEFQGDSSPFPNGHVFGGQVMGQAIVAAGRTAPEQRRIHSMYSYFLAPASATQPIRFTVDALRDGGSFSVRHVRALQGERTILEMTASFQETQAGREHQQNAPRVPAPDTLPSTADALAGVDTPAARYWADGRPIDIRHVTAPIYVAPSESTDSTQMVWMRAKRPFATSPLLHDAIIAYCSDYTPMEPIMRRQGLSWISPGLKMATINHAMWWHSHPDQDEWLLYVQQSPSAAGGRGLSTGTLYRQDGSLVATVTQEGMFRAPLA